MFGTSPQSYRNVPDAAGRVCSEFSVASTVKNSPGARPGSVSEQGFSAKLTGASLADLVQMECLANSNLAVRVVSGDDEGYLYFQGGQIVHAMSSGAMGEAAALEILTWDRGSFEPCSAGWPSVPSITRPWQALLMDAATSRDEARRSKNVVDFPRERTSAPAVATLPSRTPAAALPTRAAAPTVPTVPSMPAVTSRLPAASPSVRLPAMDTAAPPSTRDIDRAVRLQSDGKVLSKRGDADELASLTAYVMRLGTLIGDPLCMGELHAVEAVSHGKRRIFYAEKDGNLLGLEAADTVDLEPLRQKLGL